MNHNAALTALAVSILYPNHIKFVPGSSKAAWLDSTKEWHEADDYSSAACAFAAHINLYAERIEAVTGQKLLR